MTTAWETIYGHFASDDEAHNLYARLRARSRLGRVPLKARAQHFIGSPTPGSIAAAEEKLGNLSSENVGAIQQAIARARAADSAGDKDACEPALADVQRRDWSLKAKSPVGRERFSAATMVTVL